MVSDTARRRTATGINLWEIFHRLNSDHFRGEVVVSEIRWGIPDMILQDGISAVPASSYYPHDRRIVVHEILPRLRAPKYVYAYLLYHECLHQLLPGEGDGHGPVFRKRELFAPYRAKSLKWLQRKNFPVMDG